jgi:hypothetical protein
MDRILLNKAVNFGRRSKIHKLGVLARYKQVHEVGRLAAIFDDSMFRVQHGLMVSGVPVLTTHEKVRQPNIAAPQMLDLVCHEARGKTSVPLHTVLLRRLRQC